MTEEIRQVTDSLWFSDLPVLGKLPRDKVAEKLRELGEDEAAHAVLLPRMPETSRVYGSWWPSLNRAWQHTAHTFGYLAPAAPGDELLSIRHAGNIEADVTLKKARIKITLDRLRVADYPGSGTHRILFDFYAQNQVPNSIEHLHFNATYRAREAEQAAILGFPIFVGLTVGSDGVAFKCYTVNVKNEGDETFLNCLESDVFKAGLKLGTTLQPAIAPLSGLVLALTKTIASRHRNVPVQEFYLGLDFSNIPTRARLAEGAYIAVQIPETMQGVWDWGEWAYNPARGQVVSRSNQGQLIPYNYLIFSVSRYNDE
jgi:hypothetical protein